MSNESPSQDQVPNQVPSQDQQATSQDKQVLSRASPKSGHVVSVADLNQRCLCFLFGNRNDCLDVKIFH